MIFRFEVKISVSNKLIFVATCVDSDQGNSCDLCQSASHETGDVPRHVMTLKKYAMSYHDECLDFPLFKPVSFS